MKKISLLLIACFATFTVAMAASWNGHVEWPDYAIDTEEFGWGAFPKPADFGAQLNRVAEAGFSEGLFREFFSPAGGKDFEGRWNEITNNGANKLPLDQKQRDSQAVDAEVNMGAFAVAYDDDMIFLLIRFDNTKPVLVDNTVEIMISPYYKLTDYPSNGISPEGAPYARFTAMGGHKYTVGPDEVDSYMSIAGAFSGFSISASHSSEGDCLVYDGTEDNNFVRVVAIPFEALNNTESTGLDKEFGLGVWRTINEKTGFALNVKYVDKDCPPDDEGKDRTKEYQWGTTINEVYMCNIGAGHVKIKPTTKYDITINKGTIVEERGTVEGGKGELGDIVVITAAAPEAGMQFDKWEGDVTMTAANRAKATNAMFKMPAKDVTLTAIYKVQSIDGAAIQNMTIKGDQIVLDSAANVQIFSVSGALVLSVNDATQVSTSGLAAGAYIVVAGNETAKFVK